MRKARMDNRASLRVPDDWWGLGVKRVERIVKAHGSGVRLTNLTYDYDPVRCKFRINGMGAYRILARSQRSLRQVVSAIQSAVVNETLGAKEVDRLAIQAMRTWRAEAAKRRALKRKR